MSDCPHLPQYLREYHAHYKNPKDLSTKVSLGKKYATGNQMGQKKKTGERVSGNASPTAFQ